MVAEPPCKDMFFIACTYHNHLADKNIPSGIEAQACFGT